MPQQLTYFGETGVALGAALLLGSGAVVALVVLWRRRHDAVEKERRRRLEVNRHGRITSGVVLDIEGDLIHYQYAIGAVEYAACQDVSTLAERVGVDPRGIVGAVTVKYHQKNPYNSIVVCEEWSGLRGKDVRATVS